MPTSDITPGAACLIAGWGTTEDGSRQFSGPLQEGGVNVLSNSYCINHADDIYGKRLTGKYDISRSNMLKGNDIFAFSVIVSCIQHTVCYTANYAAIQLTMLHTNQHFCPDNDPVIFMVDSRFGQNCFQNYSFSFLSNLSKLFSVKKYFAAQK